MEGKLCVLRNTGHTQDPLQPAPGLLIKDSVTQMLLLAILLPPFETPSTRLVHISSYHKILH